MINWSSHARLRRAAAVLQASGVVAYPTEAVWGLGCDPFSEIAVRKILNLKQRSVNKGLILIADHADRFTAYLQGLDQDHVQRFSAVYDKPTTWLVPDNGVAPAWIVGEHATLALRIVRHPLAAALCQLFDGPLVSTSANPQGLPAAKTALKVKTYFGQHIDFVTPGVVGHARNSSEIKNILTGEVIRAG
ncbi:MAG: Sua5/YciO/YrdC/YwlC family protein [Porticoccaceae bacterium]|nr:Sua5/YciO/YrdC/YwlC family protein [Porticoccaceae bacterium]